MVSHRGKCAQTAEASPKVREEMPMDAEAQESILKRLESDTDPNSSGKLNFQVRKRRNLTKSQKWCNVIFDRQLSLFMHSAVITISIE